jgi:NADPH-dependent F420 reductase
METFYIPKMNREESMSAIKNLSKIAILGGTGREGKGLAYRWARTGYPIIIGSRNPSKAIDTADELNLKTSFEINIQGMSNEQAAKECQIAVLTIPYSAHESTLELIKEFLHGKLLIDVTVPLNPSSVTRIHMPTAGSAAQEACLILGNSVQLAAAFHNLSYENLMADNGSDICEILVTGTSEDARKITLELVKNAGFVGWDAGPIENSVVLEGLTSILIGINRKYGSKNAGIRISGVSRQ